MAVIRNLVVKIGADISGLSKGLKSAQKNLLKVSKEIEKIGKELTLKITTPMIGFASLAVTASSQIEDALLNISKGFEGTTDEIAKLMQTAKKMSLSTTQNIDEVAKSMRYLQSAGYSVVEMESSLLTISNLAIASQIEYVKATEGVVEVLSQFGLGVSETERVTNVMSATLANSTMSFDELKVGLGLVGNIAKNFGYSIEDVSAALILLTNAGYDGEEAGSLLKNMLLKLESPSSDMVKIFNELGLSINDINPSTNKLADIISAFEKVSIKTTDATRLFGDNLEDVFMTLVTKGSSSLENMTTAITGTNSAQEEAAKQMSTLSGQLKQIKMILNDIAVQLGDVLLPVLKDLLAKYILPLIEKFNGLSDSTKELITKIALLASTLGPVILLVSKIVKSMGSLSGTLSALTGPVGAIITVIALLVGGLITLYKNNEDFKNKINAIWNKIKDCIQNACISIKNFWTKYGKQITDTILKVFQTIFEVVATIIEKIIDVIGLLWESFVDFWNNNEEFRNNITAIWDRIKEIVTTAIKTIVDFWQQHGERWWNIVVGVLTKIWEVVESVIGAIIQIIATALDVITPIWNELCAVLMELWPIMLELYELLAPVFNAIVEIVKWCVDVCGDLISSAIQALKPFLDAIINVLEIITNVVGAIVDLFKGDFTGAFEHLKNVGQGFANFFSNLWDGIVSVGKWAIDGIVNIFTSLGTALGNICSGIFNTVGGWFTSLWHGIKNTAVNIWDSITGVFQDIGNWFGNLFKDAFNWGKNLVTMIGDGIKSAWEWVKNGCKTVIDTIAGWLGFGSPTKEGPGKYSDEWAPNLMDMYAQGIVDNIPNIEEAVGQVANVLSKMGNENEQMVTTGNTSMSTDILNGLLGAMSIMGNNSTETVSQPIELSIDGDVFARIMMPKLKNEFKRNGIVLKEGGF